MLQLKRAVHFSGTVRLRTLYQKVISKLPGVKMAQIYKKSADMFSGMVPCSLSGLYTGRIGDRVMRDIMSVWHKTKMAP